MSSTAGNVPMRPDSPIPVRGPGEKSLLLELHACSPPPTYLEAFRMDAARRRIEVDFTRAIAEDTQAVTPVRTPQPAAAVAGISARALPSSIAAGGAQPSTSLSSLHSSLDRPTIRSQVKQPPSGAGSHLPARKYGGRPVERAGSAYLPDEQRTLPLHAVTKENPGTAPPTPYVGHCIYVELLVPDNLEDHSLRNVNWAGNYLVVLVKEGGHAVSYRLLLDSGSPTDSWVYCNMHWKDLDRLPGRPGRNFTAEHESMYNKKAVIPLPPDGHLDKSNVADIAYGVPGNMSMMKIAQTLVKIQFNDENDNPVEFPELPMGAVIGVSPSDVERGEDGLIAMGRYGPAMSCFNSSARWRSQNLVNLLFEQRHISKNSFTIFTDHPQFVQPAGACVIFGPFYDPGFPTSFSAASDHWTSIPCLPESGYWEATLRSITVKVAGQPYEIEVDARVSFDNGSSQTYLHDKAVTDIRTHIGPLVAKSLFDEDDEVHLTFERPDRTEIKITGQAKRFFTSPYLTKTGRRCLCFEDTTKELILGQNFFMTFVVAFEDRPRNPRILVQAHEYAE